MTTVYIDILLAREWMIYFFCGCRRFPLSTLARDQRGVTLNRSLCAKCLLGCVRSQHFLSFFLSFFLSAEPVGARNFVVLLSTNFRSRYRERHQVSVICAPLLRFMDVSSDSQKDGSKIAMAHFVVPKLGFRNFYGGVAL